jgi:hypothetical protein
MTDEEVLEALRSKRGRQTPVELAELLDRLTGGHRSQGTLVMYFKRAFPEIPLRVVIDASAWSRVRDGVVGLSDAEFNELLRPWLGP